MWRAFSFALLGLAVATASTKAADKDKHQDKDFKSIHAAIGKIDSAKHTLTIKTADDKGKEQEKTLSLADDVKLLDTAGKEAKADSFKAGDAVCVMEKGGKVTEIRKEAQAKITSVDRKAGTITVQLTDEQGKRSEKTFRLVEDSEYIDSLGRVAVLDVFRSGDEVLLVEMDGRIKSLKKGHHQTQTGAKEETNHKEDKR